MSYDTTMPPGGTLEDLADQMTRRREELSRDPRTTAEFRAEMLAERAKQTAEVRARWMAKYDREVTAAQAELADLSPRRRRLDAAMSDPRTWTALHEVFQRAHPADLEGVVEDAVRAGDWVRVDAAMTALDARLAKVPPAERSGVERRLQALLVDPVKLADRREKLARVMERHNVAAIANAAAAGRPLEPVIKLSLAHKANDVRHGRGDDAA